jgi:hypothetical protein
MVKLAAVARTAAATGGPVSPTVGPVPTLPPSVDDAASAHPPPAGEDLGVRRSTRPASHPKPALEAATIAQLPFLPTVDCIELTGPCNGHIS